MLKIVYGNDIDSRKKELKTLEKTFKDLPKIEFDDTSFHQEDFLSLSRGYGLFDSTKYIVLLNVLSNKEHADIVLDNLKEVAESDHVFVFLDTDLSKDTLKAVKKHTDSCVECLLKKTAKSEYNIFNITNKIASKDKKGSWLELHQALKTQASFEQLVGIIFWKLKKMIVESKDKGKSGTYNQKDLEAMFLGLLEVHIRSRQGFANDLLLESWVLKYV